LDAEFPTAEKEYALPGHIATDMGLTNSLHFIVKHSEYILSDL